MIGVTVALQGLGHEPADRPGGGPEHDPGTDAEDNDYVFGTLLGLTEDQQQELAADDVI